MCGELALSFSPAIVVLLSTFIRKFLNKLNRAFRKYIEMLQSPSGLNVVWAVFILPIVDLHFNEVNGEEGGGGRVRADNEGQVCVCVCVCVSEKG